MSIEAVIQELQTQMNIISMRAGSMAGEIADLKGKITQLETAKEVADDEATKAMEEFRKKKPPKKK